MAIFRGRYRESFSAPKAQRAVAGLVARCLITAAELRMGTQEDRNLLSVPRNAVAQLRDIVVMVTQDGQRAAAGLHAQAFLLAE